LSKIMYVDLDRGKISEEAFVFKNLSSAGRGLAVQLIGTQTDLKTGHRRGNCLVLAPGLLTGTKVPSTGRLVIAGLKVRERGLHLANTAGPFAQKLASQGVSALVVTGSYSPGRTAVIHIRDEGADLHVFPELHDKPVGETIGYLREKWGEGSAIVGVGPAGEHMLPLAGVFSTYPARGIPVFSVSRDKVGEVFGSLGLKAVVISTKPHFLADVQDREKLWLYSKQLSRLIVQHPVCGGALPAYGSLTLMKMLQEYNPKEAFQSKAQGKKAGVNKGGFTVKERKEKEEQCVNRAKGTIRLNRSCTIGCVVGCLNRHAGSSGEILSSPMESEVKAACREMFGINDPHFARRITLRCFEFGLDPMEFLAGCKMLFEAEGTSGQLSAIEHLAEEVEKLSLRGRALASTTAGLAALFADDPALQPLVTRPSEKEASSFIVRLPYREEGLEDISDLDYLFAYTIVSANLGLCLFTSFALLESPRGLQILSNLIEAKTGEKIPAGEIIREGLQCIRSNEILEEELRNLQQLRRIPEFIKVLLRYFQVRGEKQ